MHFYQRAAIAPRCLPRPPDPIPQSVVTRFATQRLTSRGVLRRRRRLPPVRGRAVSRGSGFLEETQIIAPPDCTLDLRATPEFPKKGFVEKEPSASRRLHTQRGMKRKNTCSVFLSWRRVQSVNGDDDFQRGSRYNT